MQEDPTPAVLTFDLQQHPRAVQVMDHLFRLPAGRDLCGKNGQIDWEFFSRRGKEIFGKRMLFFHSQTQFEASLKLPDKPFADACEAERNAQKGCILPLGKDDTGVEWGTNLSHFTYKSQELSELAVQFAGNLLGFHRCNTQNHFFYYPPGAYREWHTNEGSPQPGWRIYLVKAAEAGKSYFSYLNHERLVNSPDGHYSVRIFRFGGGTNFYHSVTSVDTDRFSYGIRPNDWPFETMDEARHFLEDRLGLKTLP